MNERREPSREEIARRAHELYLQRGGEHGKNVEDWLRAEKELSEKSVAGPTKTRATQAGRSASVRSRLLKPGYQAVGSVVSLVPLDVYGVN